LVKAIDYTRPTITKTVDVAFQQRPHHEERDGTRRLDNKINRDRLDYSRKDPYLGIPQSEFHGPVKAATEAILEKPDDVLWRRPYGSVARMKRTVEATLTQALVREISGWKRQEGSGQSLEEDTFDGNRYAYEIDVEGGLQAIPNYVQVNCDGSSGTASPSTEQTSSTQSAI